MKTKLYREICLNPFFYEGKEINYLNFYKEGKVIACINWFSSNNVYKTLEFDFEIKKAIKINLNRKDCFLVRNDKKWCKSYDLYIYADLVQLQSVGVSEGAKCWYHIETHENFEVKLYGERYQYIKNELGKFDRVPVKGEYIEKFCSNYHFEKTKELIKCEKISADLTKVCQKEITPFDVYYMLQNYNITPKKK